MEASKPSVSFFATLITFVFVFARCSSRNGSNRARYCSIGYIQMDVTGSTQLACSRTSSGRQVIQYLSQTLVVRGGLGYSRSTARALQCQRGLAGGGGALPRQPSIVAAWVMRSSPAPRAVWPGSPRHSFLPRWITASPGASLRVVACIGCGDARKIG